MTKIDSNSKSESVENQANSLSQSGVTELSEELDVVVGGAIPYLIALQIQAKQYHPPTIQFRVY